MLDVVGRGRQFKMDCDGLIGEARRRGRADNTLWTDGSQPIDVGQDS